jgi:hypothetical protein
LCGLRPYVCVCVWCSLLSETLQWNMYIFGSSVSRPGDKLLIHPNRPHVRRNRIAFLVCAFNTALLLSVLKIIICIFTLVSVYHVSSLVAIRRYCVAIRKGLWICLIVLPTHFVACFISSCLTLGMNRHIGWGYHVSSYVYHPIHPLFNTLPLYGSVCSPLPFWTSPLGTKPVGYGLGFSRTKNKYVCTIQNMVQKRNYTRWLTHYQTATHERTPINSLRTEWLIYCYQRCSNWNLISPVCLLLHT